MRFDDANPFKKIVLSWWQQFDPARRSPEKAAFKGPSLRGDLAELRRCGSATEVIFCAGFQRLWTSLRQAELVAPGQGDERWVAVVAGVLAHVEENIAPEALPAGSSFAVQMARPRTGTDPVVSDLRFRKLLRATDPEGLFTLLSSTVRLLRGATCVPELAWDIHWLCSPFHEQQRKRWALAYYETAILKDNKK